MTSNADRADVLTRALHAGIEGDRGTLTKVFTDDVKAWTPAMAAASLDELLLELDRRDDAFSEMELETTALDTGGDYACVEWSVGMTHTGALALRDGETLEPTGLRVTLHGVTIAEFEGERICALRQYWDELAVFEQLGLL